ncbi:uncharacterized protein LACBIDRAFT_308383 [Laccaria bicolor S238N-H82]|uniref:Predicted protein n=1 Tax=Laccaria bicolor (strain S238N-H82 / ATCC MYA-4686) TaxID=486041 RepID=B0CW54_LACBS|nr:uncharacterized protein LACBIDRAFT_308383 [Laccaria bicolor S238N-H82]EDR13006.1 predicted protein [Laccaria bicolor S238N-H82]|eukprot:XP_001875504.1 predicted protein [Laccaria bicolor S238N-H82]
MCPGQSTDSLRPLTEVHSLMNTPDCLQPSSSSSRPSARPASDNVLANTPSIVMGQRWLGNDDSIFTDTDSQPVSPSQMVIELTDSPVSSAQEFPPATPPPPPVDGTGTNDEILVIACGNCTARNVVETVKDYYYVVFKGRGAVGVFWSLEAADLVCVSVPNAFRRKYTTQSAAFEVLAHAECTNTIAWL